MIRLLADNPWADEADFWSFAVAPDGVFERVHAWSNGGTEDTIETCIGRVP